MLSMMDRGLILVRPTEVYIQWLQSVDPNYQEADAREIREGEPTAYLVEENDEKPLQKTLAAVLEKSWRAIAQEELSSWYNNPDAWPDLRNADDFKKYFSVQCVEMVFDTLEEEIQRDPIV